MSESEEKKEQAGQTKVLQNVKDEISKFSNAIWFAGWLFTIGFVGLKGRSVLWALVIRPCYLGANLK